MKEESKVLIATIVLLVLVMALFATSIYIIVDIESREKPIQDTDEQLVVDALSKVIEDSGAIILLYDISQMKANSEWMSLDKVYLMHTITTINWEKCEMTTIQVVLHEDKSIDYTVIDVHVME